jgi:hypothetical protein
VLPGFSAYCTNRTRRHPPSNPRSPLFDRRCPSATCCRAEHRSTTCDITYNRARLVVYGLRSTGPAMDSMVERFVPFGRNERWRCWVGTARRSPPASKDHGRERRRALARRKILSFCWSAAQFVPTGTLRGPHRAFSFMLGVVHVASATVRATAARRPRDATATPLAVSMLTARWAVATDTL